MRERWVNLFWRMGSTWDFIRDVVFPVALLAWVGLGLLGALPLGLTAMVALTLALILIIPRH